MEERGDKGQCAAVLAARPGSGAGGAPRARLGISPFRLARRPKVCEHSGGAARTCRFIGRAGTQAMPVTSRSPLWVEAGGRRGRGYYPKTTRGWQAPHLPGAWRATGREWELNPSCKLKTHPLRIRKWEYSSRAST